eukprot:NODE_2329_length_717_cov_287.407186_g1887_i0.p1 GENE.NODE_2329_length_717_cov_287.407186_g1887_i0~~NODE_2329_length_717_cov_287.407186_g1887_i0.p1  ORF type:complete len:183 (+),score=12.56 NODE_2329_length_717_cov_287.407186_g1887_i0:77-550(+)
MSTYAKTAPKAPEVQAYPGTFPAAYPGLANYTSTLPLTRAMAPATGYAQPVVNAHPYTSYGGFGYSGFGYGPAPQQVVAAPLATPQVSVIAAPQAVSVTRSVAVPQFVSAPAVGYAAPVAYAPAPMAYAPAPMAYAPAPIGYPAAYGAAPVASIVRA